jgi:hypothetical protein
MYCAAHEAVYTDLLWSFKKEVSLHLRQILNHCVLCTKPKTNIAYYSFNIFLLLSTKQCAANVAVYTALLSIS